MSSNLDESLIAPSQIQAVIGELNLENSSKLIKHKIEKIIYHHDYKSKSLISKSDADIALLIMKTKVNFTNYIQPICLPNSYENEIESVGFLVGHGGLVGSTEHQNIAKFYKLSAEDLNTCYQSHSNSGNVLGARSFCANSNISEICKGKNFERKSFEKNSLFFR